MPGCPARRSGEPGRGFPVTRFRSKSRRPTIRPLHFKKIGFLDLGQTASGPARVDPKSGKREIEPNPNGGRHMFCYQCEQTAKGLGCDKLGVCGKKPEISDLQDLLVYALTGLGQAAAAAKAEGDGRAARNRPFFRQSHVLDADQRQLRRRRLQAADRRRPWPSATPWPASA